MTDLQTIPLDQLQPHPDNPRLQLREDVLERLTTEIARTGFGAEHALLVRPIYVPKLDEPAYFQLVSGHHRAEAARRAGLSEVPAWVREMDDDEAFMQLVLSNTQGELSPLEIGMHALTFESAQGKAGGGLQAYADRIGADRSRISQLRSAAKVVASLPREMSNEVRDKPYHLYEISKAPSEVWKSLVAQLLKKGWSVADTKGTVEKVRKFDIPAEHSEWLPLTNVVERFLASDKPSPAAVDQLLSTVDGILAAIERDGTEEDKNVFLAWLTNNRGKDSWDRRKISDYHVTLIREWAERAAAAAAAAAEEEDEGPRLPDGIDLRLGDFREVLEDLEPGTVDAIITDPPYPAEFLPLYGIREGHDETDGLNNFREEGLAEIAARILKPGGICAVMVGQSYLPEIIERMTGRNGLTYHWTLAYLTPGGQATQLWQRKVNTFWKPILVFVNGEYDGTWFGDVATSDVNDNDKRHHHWGQSESGMADLLERLTKPGNLICDPFLGGGTTAVVAYNLGRRFIGCDIDETHVNTTIERFGGAEA